MKAKAMSGAKADAVGDGFGVMTDEQAEAVVMAVMRGHAPDSVKERDLQRAIEALNGMAVMGALADLVFDGKLDIRMKRGEPLFMKRPDERGGAR